MDRHCNNQVPTYKVLNHGDFWTNNFLFKYDADDKTPIDVCFVDYQMSFYTSPGHDLNYFLNTSPNNVVRKTQREHIIQLYHRTFAAELRQLQSPQADRLTLQLLEEQVRRRELFGLAAATGILPLVLMTRGGGDDVSIESMASEETRAALQKALYTNPGYVEAMKYITRRFDEQGVLDNVPGA